jgi:predicted small integral membrane protein
VVVRLCKAALVATVGLLMSLVALGNVLDYGSNWQFLRHVMSMDTAFPGSTQHWRAVTSGSLQQAAYLAIIAAEALGAALLLAGSARLFAGARSAARFDAAVPLAAAGLTLVMLIYGAGFLAIGGEWFEMWQSSAWNGQNAAARFFTVAAAVLVVLLTGRPPARD